MVNVQSTVDCMPPVLHPMTENETMQHILQVSVDATKVKLNTSFLTGDLAVAKKALLAGRVECARANRLGFLMCGSLLKTRMLQRVSEPAKSGNRK